MRRSWTSTGRAPPSAGNGPGDRRLSIAYVPQYKVLEFDVLPAGDGQRTVFEELEEQLRQGRSGPFIRIERDAHRSSAVSPGAGALVSAEGEP